MPSPHDADHTQVAHQAPHATARLGEPFPAYLLPDLAGAVGLVVLSPDALNNRFQYLVAHRSRRPFRWIELAGTVTVIRQWGDRHDAADRLRASARSLSSPPAAKV
jgi:hypothetical protein